MESIEEEGVEDHFNNQVTAFKRSTTLSKRSASISLNLQDSMVENHNFFNGTSPTDNLLSRSSIHGAFEYPNYTINYDDKDNII
jgi:hypothetical protein